MTTTSASPPPIDVEALLTSLYTVAATYQARALGARHLVEAAKQRQMGILAADAAKEAAVYEDVVSRIYGQIDAVRAEVRQRHSGKAAPTAASTAAPTTATSPPFKAVLDADLRRTLDLAVNVKAPPLDRYSAFVRLSAQAVPSTVLSAADTATLADAYHAVWDALPDIAQVIDAFEGVGVRGADWASKCEGWRRIAVAAAEQQHDTVGPVVGYREDLAGLETYLRSLPQRGGKGQQMAEEALRQLSRLRDDCAIRVWLARLKVERGQK